MAPPPLLRTRGPAYHTEGPGQPAQGPALGRRLPVPAVVTIAFLALAVACLSAAGGGLPRAGWAIHRWPMAAPTQSAPMPSRPLHTVRGQVRDPRAWPLQAAKATTPPEATPPTPAGPPASFAALGVSPELVAGLASVNILTPSPIQRLVIPKLRSGASLAFGATTGSGKTLAYMLPLIQALKDQERAGVNRKDKRPRALVFVPTRELASQVVGVAKALGHHAKIASCMVVGGEEWARQREALEGRMDIVVATPGRLLEHWKKSHFYLSEVTKVVIDEVDTMLTQGFTAEIMTLLNHVLEPTRSVQVMMATATMTRQVKAWLEVSKFKNLQILEAPDVNRVVSSLKHVLVETKGRDKMQVLQEVIRGHGTVPRTMVFCNTVDAVRAVSLSLNELGIEALSYHKELPLGERTASMQRFRDGAVRFLVCTDIGQRGLDIDIEHVILFDFPLNSVDFLHRAGRTARMGKPGTVTSIVSKKEFTLARAIDAAIAKGQPLERLTGNPNDYKDGGRLAALVGRVPKADDRRRRKPKPKPAAPTGKAGGKPAAKKATAEGTAAPKDRPPAAPAKPANAAAKAGARSSGARPAGPGRGSGPGRGPRGAQARSPGLRGQSAAQGPQKAGRTR